MTTCPKSCRSLLACAALVTVAILVFGNGNNVVGAEEYPTFFLKVAKSIPRIGRRSNDFDDFFLKASKNVPRIGRRGAFAPSSLKATGPLPWYRSIENFPEPSKRPTDLPYGDEPWTWNQIAREIEDSPGHLKSMSGFTDDASQSMEGGSIDNEMWQREKRTGSGASSV